MPTTTELIPSVRNLPTRSTARHRAISSLTAVPFDPVYRWALRLALAVPFLALSVVLGASPANGVSGNLLLLHKVAELPDQLSGVAGFNALYPPISTVAGLLLTPFGQMAFSIAGSLVAGFLLQKLIEVLIQRGAPVWATVGMLIVAAANPLFAYLVTSNLPVVLALAAFGIGVTHMMRFIMWGATSYGFRAGLLFLVALMCDQTALFFVLAANLSAPFIKWKREGERGARRASIFVLLFPALFGVAALFLLQVVFTGDASTVLGIHVLDGLGDHAATIGRLFTQPQGVVLWGPALAIAALSLLMRSPGLALMGGAQLIAICVGFTLGLVTVTATGITYVVTVFLVLTMQPQPRGRFQIANVSVIGAALVAIAWLAASMRPYTVAWMDTLALGAQALFGG